MKLYRIRDWETIYENNRTRELKSLSWVPIPNNHDGDGYTILVDRKDGAALLGAWVACVQVASKCDPRGTLVRRGGIPHDAASLSRITRLPVAIFESVLAIATHECKWLIVSEVQDPAEIPHPPAEIPQQGALKGREGKGMEGKGTPKPPTGVPATAGEEGKLVTPASLNTPEFLTQWEAWKTYRRRRKSSKDFDSMFAAQLKWLSGHPVDIAIAIMAQSIRNDWQGLFELRQSNERTTHQSGAKQSLSRNTGTANEGRASDYASAAEQL